MIARRRLAAAFAVLALATLLAANPAQAAMTVMQGFADYTGVLLWMRTDRAGPVANIVAPGGRRRPSL
jgi:hypothetical protein